MLRCWLLLDHVRFLSCIVVQRSYMSEKDSLISRFNLIYFLTRFVRDNIGPVRC